MANMNKTSPASPPPPESPVSKFIIAAFTLFGMGPKSGQDKKQEIAPLPEAAPALQGTEKEETALPTDTDTTQVPTAAGGPLMAVVVRNEFYRDGFRTMLRIALAEAVVIVLVILVFIVHVNASRPKNFYFATTADGRIIQLMPLNQPNMGTSSLMSWVAQASTEVMTFGFHDYQRRMQQSSRHFTRRGWESFTAALQKARIIESVEAGKQSVTAQPRSAPILIQEGVFNGKYRWVVDLPLTVNYQGSVGTRTDNLTVRLVIDRVSSLENPSGVGIEQWIAVAGQQ